MAALTAPQAPRFGQCVHVHAYAHAQVCVCVCVCLAVCLLACLPAEEHASNHVPRPGSECARVCMPEAGTKVTSTQKTRQVDPHSPHPREHRLAP